MGRKSVPNNGTAKSALLPLHIIPSQRTNIDPTIPRDRFRVGSHNKDIKRKIRKVCIPSDIGPKSYSHLHSEKESIFLRDTLSSIKVAA